MDDPNITRPTVPKRKLGWLSWISQHAALVRGISVMALLLLGLLVLLAHLAEENAKRDQEAGNRVQSRYSLQQIGLAISLYTHDHGSQYPDTFGTLLLNEDIPADGFISPGSTTDTPATGPTAQAIADQISRSEHVSYHYLGRGLTTATAKPDTIIAYEDPSIFQDGGNVLYGDGDVRFVDADALKKIAVTLATMP